MEILNIIGKQMDVLKEQIAKAEEATNPTELP